MKLEPIVRKKKEKKKISHLTMMVIPHSHGAAIKNYCVPMWLFKSFMVISISCILIVSYFTAGYFLFRYAAEENKELKEVNMAQAQEISELKGLAGSMKSKLEYLVQLDKEVREKVGLAKDNKESIDEARNIQSSRSDIRTQIMTIGVGTLAIGAPQPIVEQLAFNSSIPKTEQLSDAADMTLETVDIMELPALEGEIDTLEDLKEQLALMDSMMTQQEESINQLNTDVDKQLAYLSALPNTWPIKGRITSWFGWRKNPYSHRGSEFHEGIDIASTYGAPIRAAGNGVVTFAGYKGSWGRLVVISHGYGYVSQYAHNSSLLVKVGDKVKRGDVIARLGNTGRSTGAHVHFGVAKNSKWINPLDLINAADK